MINNEGKVAVIFGVRNESSIAWDVALKLHRSGCKVALSYMADTKAEVLHLMEQNGMNAVFAAEVDVRNEEEITAFIKHAHDGLGPINYVLHGVAFGSQNVMCYTIPGVDEPAPEYINIPFEEFPFTPYPNFCIISFGILNIRIYFFE